MKTTIVAPRCRRVGAVHCIKSGSLATMPPGFTSRSGGSHLAPPQPAAEDHTTLPINAMDLKYVLRKINTNRDNFSHRTAPVSRWFMKTTILAPRCRRVGAVHCIKNGHSLAPWTSKFRPSDGCGRDAVPLAVGRRYDFPEFGGYLGYAGCTCFQASRPWRETLKTETRARSRCGNSLGNAVLSGDGRCH